MSADPVSFTLHGVIDHARAEAIVARIRSAVRNGRSAISITCEPGAVIASPNLLAFLLRAAGHLRERGGRLDLSGDPAVLDQMRGLGILAQLTQTSAATTQGESP